LCPTPSVTPEAASHPFLTTIEAELVALNEQYDAFIDVYDRTGRMDTGKTADPGSVEAIKCAEGHAVRLRRMILQTALALPAGSIVALGLQARLIASETPDWWGEVGIGASEEACRDLLVRLMGLANVKPVKRPDVTPEELQGWIDNPETRPGGGRYSDGAAQ